MHSESTAMMHELVNATTGTPGWMAPELLPNMMNNAANAASAELHYTKATDVYAFALVCHTIQSEYPLDM
jgi:serine/threonine protein kinase